MRVMYLGDHGTDVVALQGLLKRYDPTVTPDGQYGPKTERTVRLAQRRLGLFPPDGRAGPVTLSALAKAAQPTAPSFADRARSAFHKAEQVAATAEAQVASWWHALVVPAPPIPTALRHAVAPAIRRAMTNTPPPGEVRDPRLMRLSLPGRQFIFRHEAGTGRTTAHLHHPNGVSGVTIGAGYDMGARSKQSVAQDLIRAGVAPATATQAAEGAGLHGAAADAFVKAHKSLLDLSLRNQVDLLIFDEQTYERMVKRRIKVPLHQHEFDALVSYAGNPGKHGWPKVVDLVNQHRYPDAMSEIHRHTAKPGDRARQGLINRRNAEARLFLYGDYKCTSGR